MDHKGLIKNERLMRQPLLVLLNFTKSFEVHCDACDDSIRAILSQEGHSIVYESRHLQPQEMIQQIYEKELLTIIHALDYWKSYLLGIDGIRELNRLD